MNATDKTPDSVQQTGLAVTGWFDVFVRDYNRCVKRTERDGRLTIACKLGLWSVDGPRDLCEAVEAVTNYFDNHPVVDAAAFFAAMERSKARAEEMPGWNFDPTYIREVSGESEFDAGGMAIFRIVKDGAEKFVHLFNSHNGYYGHGFDFKSGDTAIKDGCL